MLEKNFDITWIPLVNPEDQFIGISHCPGKYSKDQGSSVQLYNDLKSLKRQKVDVIISLISEIEIKRLGIANFREHIKQSGFIHFVEPIEDFSVPRSERMESVNELIINIINFLKNNKSVLIHCNTGFGRSGIIVGIVIKFIAGLKDPVSHVRKYRPGAVETKDQKRFVADFSLLNLE